MISRRAESGTLPGTYTDLKRGRKPCSNCDVIIGAGRKSCPVCGANFGSKTQTATSQSTSAVKSIPVLAGSCRGSTVREVTVIPSGPCPFVLSGTKVSEVIDWADSVAAHWLASQNSSALGLEALEYWVRSFFPYKSKEYTTCCAILRDRLGVPA